MKYRETIFFVCLGFAKNPLDAEELTQETYLKAYKNINNIKSKETAKEWLFKIARNTCLDNTKKARLRRFLRLEEEKEPVEGKNPEAQLLWNEQLRLLKKSISNLPDKLREVFILREYGLLSYQEISRSLGIKEGTVMSRLRRARQAVMDRLRSEQ
ncbi:MAG: sigma-70 family RNA polymerase sigma factor [Candidatus Aminicenantes bacterium]|nr:sigma-70 family RNA polymerase sigma factor [Candidatus Aminicenantes bacterium]